MLPRGVHKITSGGRVYFYYQTGRGTSHVGPRIPLPKDPTSPEFWQAIRQAQGIAGRPPADTVGAVIDAYLTSPAFLTKVTEGSQALYKRELETARRAWGSLQAAGLRPMHVQELVDGMVGTPGKANNFLGVMSALSRWARTHGDPFGGSLTEGCEGYEKKGGHKPWTPEQIKAANKKLKGVIRRGILIYLYTGMRGSDVVRLGWTDVDDGGFNITTKKRNRDVWCPIVPELEAEMATWEKRPGPFLLRESGRRIGQPYTRFQFWKEFSAARKNIPELADVTLHGLRCTAVIRLRREGLTPLQIQDIVGMSLATIERYCRFADRKTSGQAALYHLTRGTPDEHSCKITEKL